jgi:hypothetical protein
VLYVEQRAERRDRIKGRRTDAYDRRGSWGAPALALADVAAGAPVTGPDYAQLWKHDELLGQAEGVAVGLGAPEVIVRRRGPLWRPALSFGAGDSLVSPAARRRVAAAALGIVLLVLGSGG